MHIASNGRLYVHDPPGEAPFLLWLQTPECCGLDSHNHTIYNLPGERQFLIQTVQSEHIGQWWSWHRVFLLQVPLALPRTPRYRKRTPRLKLQGFSCTELPGLELATKQLVIRSQDRTEPAVFFASSREKCAIVRYDAQDKNWSYLQAFPMRIGLQEAQFAPDHSLLFSGTCNNFTLPCQHLEWHGVWMEVPTDTNVVGFLDNEKVLSRNGSILNLCKPETRHVATMLPDGDSSYDIALSGRNDLLYYCPTAFGDHCHFIAGADFSVPRFWQIPLRRDMVLGRMEGVWNDCLVAHFTYRGRSTQDRLLLISDRDLVVLKSNARKSSKIHSSRCSIVVNTSTYRLQLLQLVSWWPRVLWQMIVDYIVY